MNDFQERITQELNMRSVMRTGKQEVKDACICRANPSECLGKHNCCRQPLVSVSSSGCYLEWLQGDALAHLWVHWMSLRASLRPDLCWQGADKILRIWVRGRGHIVFSRLQFSEWIQNEWRFIQCFIFSYWYKPNAKSSFFKIISYSEDIKESLHRTFKMILFADDEQQKCIFVFGVALGQTKK